MQHSHSNLQSVVPLLNVKMINFLSILETNIEMGEKVRSLPTNVSIIVAFMGHMSAAGYFHLPMILTLPGARA